MFYKVKILFLFTWVSLGLI